MFKFLTRLLNIEKSTNRMEDERCKYCTWYLHKFLNRGKCLHVPERERIPGSIHICKDVKASDTCISYDNRFTHYFEQ